MRLRQLLRPKTVVISQKKQRLRQLLNYFPTASNQQDLAVIEMAILPSSIVLTFYNMKIVYGIINSVTIWSSFLSKTAIII